MYKYITLDGFDLKYSFVWSYNRITIRYFDSIGCKVGYYGYNCTTQCRYPNFGEKCQKVCNCTEDLCDHRFGCILPQSMITHLYLNY